MSKRPVERDRDGAGLAVLAGILGMIALAVLAIAFGR